MKCEQCKFYKDLVADDWHCGGCEPPDWSGFEENT
jgi:hypothetical protein